MTTKHVLKPVLTVATFFLFISVLISQNSAEVSGKLIDPKGVPLSFANIILYTAQDSSIVTVDVSGDEGEFLFQGLPAGHYWLQISFIGLVPLDHAFSLAANEKKELDVLQVQASGGLDLEQVVVTAQRPILELKGDKMIFNVENSINAAGGNGLDLLRLTPGVVIDNDRNITILGRPGVRIFIDGRPSPLQGEDLANYLETLQSTDIDAIEVITNPGSKYEAQGNAGIINIRMKKNLNLGGNGSVNLGYQATGKGYAGYVGGFSGNYRNEKINLFGNYSYNERHDRGYIISVDEQGPYRKDNNIKWFNDRIGHTVKAGMDLFLNPKHTVGFMFDAGINDRSGENISRIDLGVVGTNDVDSVLLATRNTNNHNENYNVNANYLFNITKDQELSIDFNYGVFNSNQDEYQPNSFVDPTENDVLVELINEIERSRAINLFTLRVDYERPLGKGTLGTGVKASYVTTDNDFDFFNRVNGQQIVNIDRTNNFIYEENVNAAYANYSAKINDQLNYQIGLRAEQTLSTGELVALKETENDLVKRSYLDLFPSASLNYTLNDKHSFQLSYSRRINRPNYNNLNPFESKATELGGSKGNPFLRPEYSNSFQLRHSFDFKINTTLAYSHTKDMMLRQVDAGEKNISLVTWLNLADQYNYSINIAAPLAVTKWWSSFSSITGFYRHNVGKFEEGKSIDLSASSVYVNSQQTFKLNKDISLELSGRYNSRMVWGGSFLIKPSWVANAGVQVKVLGGKGNLKFAVKDLFKTSFYRISSTFGIINVDGRIDFNADRWFNMNFTYNFGNNKVKKARRRNTGSEDERKRMGGEG